MEQPGEESKERVRTQAIRVFDRPQQRAWISARWRRAARDDQDGLADLRRLVEERQPRSWHV